MILHHPSRPRWSATIVYESLFGNTEQIATGLGEVLFRAGIAVQVLEASEWAGSQPDADVLIVGAPTHRLSLSRPQTRARLVRLGADPARVALGVREVLPLLPQATAGQLAVAYDTRMVGERDSHRGAGRRASTMLFNRGFTIARPPVSFLVDEMTGRLAWHELDRAKAWAGLLIGWLEDARAETALVRPAR